MKFKRTLHCEEITMNYGYACVICDVPKKFSCKRCRGVICIRSCPEAEVEGLEADIVDLEDIAIVEDPGVDVEGPEANV
jgi:hypothetical protein